MHFFVLFIRPGDLDVVAVVCSGIALLLRRSLAGLLPLLHCLPPSLLPLVGWGSKFNDKTRVKHAGLCSLVLVFVCGILGSE